MKSGSISALEEEIFNFGHAYRFMPQAWILVSEVSLNTIRSELIQKLGKLDTLIVVDTSTRQGGLVQFRPRSRHQDAPDVAARSDWRADSA